jgi:hypothetical protein
MTMPDTPNDPDPSTTAASAATAQSREAPVEETRAPRGSRGIERKEGEHFTIGAGVRRAVGIRPYRRGKGAPLYRPLRIYSSDPAASVLEGAIALVKVPYEPLKAGPTGSLFEVREAHEDAGDEDYGPERTGFEGDHDVRCGPLNLDDPLVLLVSGRTPSSSDFSFHRQMVYAVSWLVYAAFRVALGRDLSWNFDPPAGARGRTGTRLRLRPHGFGGRNALYDRSLGEVSFGYYEADPKVAGREIPSGLVFTCLSHDIIAHELTHGLVDGLRAQFATPSNPDVPAFHEAFADLVAVFQHFSYDDVVKAAIGNTRGRLNRARLLTDLATQFGHTTGSDQPLRSAVLVDEPDEKPPTTYGHSDEPHARGQVLVTAVFEAFNTVFMRKVARDVRLATAGTGVLPRDAELPVDLKEVLAERASKLASQFLTMCIRAIDYCPPVDVEFGEFLRAVITADYDLVPDDPWAYREAWLDAFRRRDIHPSNVNILGQDAAVWRPPERTIPNERRLSYARLQFEGEPGHPAGLPELQRQARALGSLVTQPDHLETFGLAALDDARALGKLALPCIESVRSSRRIGPDGQVVFDLVAEVTQRLTVPADGDAPSFDFYGGSTVIVGPDGDIRYVIAKHVLSEARLKRQREFIASTRGQQFWRFSEDGKAASAAAFFELLDTNGSPESKVPTPAVRGSR